MEFFDSHLHLTCGGFLPSELDHVLEHAKAAGVARMVNVCTSSKALIEGIALQKRAPNLSLAAAIPPHDLEFASDLNQILPLLPHLVAIGETGLEYFHQPVDKICQRALFERHLAIAQAAHLPLIIHCRDAFEDFFAITDQFSVRGVLHCFTGTEAAAKKLLDRGWMLSFSGIVTFKKSVALQEIAKWLPLDALLIETDAPYLAPQSQRGQKNQPAYLVETAQCIANLKKLPLEEIAMKTFDNATRLFG